MQKLFIPATQISPEINFSPDENIFYIKGISAPEDVRGLYYPVIEWFRLFIDSLLEGRSKNRKLRMQIDLEYFNSSSAKFLLDIFIEMKRLHPARIEAIVEWVYDEEDYDLKEAGEDIASLIEMEFDYIPKKR